jgi:hypothetical protein
VCLTPKTVFDLLYSIGENLAPFLVSDDFDSVDKKHIRRYYTSILGVICRNIYELLQFLSEILADFFGSWY